MKVFIPYTTRKATDAFEGSRVRKTLKGACEVADISWVDSPREKVDVAHFLSPSDHALLKEKKKEGVPCVVSAFYAEDDPRAGFLTKREKPKLTKRSLAMLNEADLILVPTERLKQFAKDSGVTTNIEVLEPAVRINRFSNTAAEAKIFRRYFGVRPEEKIVVATGTYYDKKAFNSIKKTVKACPNLSFYFFGATYSNDRLGLFRFIRGFGKPHNLHFQNIVQDDIYRSALMNSVAYIATDSSRPNAIGPMEAFASKTQVVAFEAARSNSLLVEGETCYFFKTPEEMGKYLSSLNSGIAESTIVSAYEIAKSRNLIHHGKKLKKFYNNLIQED